MNMQGLILSAAMAWRSAWRQQRRAGRAIGQNRSSQRYAPAGRTGDEGKLMSRMLELAQKHPRYGYRRI